MKIVEFISEKKAQDIVVLDVSKISGLCDYFVICSGTSITQVRAIFEETLKVSKKNKIRIQHYEDDQSCRWILMDFFDVMVHIFLDEAREFYNLEYLWNEAKKVRVLKKYLSN